jgi:hypothetical protein
MRKQMDKLGRKASKVNDSMMLIPPEKVANQGMLAVKYLNRIASAWLHTLNTTTSVQAFNSDRVIVEVQVDATKFSSPTWRFLRLKVIQNFSDYNRAIKFS